MSVLITGATGQIGSYLLEHLLRRYDVIGVDLKQFKNDLDKFVVLCDLRRRESVERLFSKFRPKIVLHLAAQVSVEKSWKNPEFDAENNIISTINMLNLSAKYNVSKFIYFSSAAVYGQPKYIPIDENHPLNPTSPYGVSKLVGELYCRLYSSKIDITILRPFNVFSDRINPNNPYSGVIAKFVWRVKKGLPPVIYGDGKQTRDFIHVSDIVEFVDIIINNLDSSKLSVYNVGTGRETSILELARIITSLAGMDLEPIFEKERKGDIKRSCANIKKAKTIGFKPKTNLKKYIKILLKTNC